MALFIIYAVAVILLTTIVYFAQKEHGDFLEIKGLGLQRFTRALFLVLLGLTFITPNPVIPDVFWSFDNRTMIFASIAQVVFNMSGEFIIGFITIGIIKLFQWTWK